MQQGWPTVNHLSTVGLSTISSINLNNKTIGPVSCRGPIATPRDSITTILRILHAYSDTTHLGGDSKLTSGSRRAAKHIDICWRIMNIIDIEGTLSMFVRATFVLKSCT